MMAYIGAKIILAEPMDECTFLSKHRQEDTGKRPTRAGYHVVYSNPDGSEYHSWSPKEVFDIAYREVTSGELAFVCGGGTKGGE